MKDYRQLLKELPSNTVVCALGDFDPPTVGHELLVKTVKRLAEQKGSAHIIYTSPSETLQEEKKSQYLKLMFPKTNFASIEESFATSVENLKQKYKNVIIVAGTSQINNMRKSLKESVEIIAINEKNPDSDTSKMKAFATKALYEEFKKKLPSTLRELDSRRLMNDVRTGMGLEPVKEQINLVKDDLREQYFRGEIFNVDDIVESNRTLYTIVKRGSNHLLLKEQSGELVSKWINDVKLVENHTTIEHNSDHKEFNHGADFSMKVGKEHHGKIGNLKHGEQHEFKCMDGNEWTVEKRHDNIHFTGHKQDTGISSNISFHVPHTHFTGEEEPESEDTKQIKSFSQMLMDKAQKEPHKLTPQERTLINMVAKTGFSAEVNEGVIQQNGTDQVVPSGPDKVDAKDQNGNPTPRDKGVKKGFLTFYNYTKDKNDFKVAKMESVDHSTEDSIEEARMSAAVKLQRAFDRERMKSDASRRRGEELLKKTPPNTDTSRNGPSDFGGSGERVTPVTEAKKPKLSALDKWRRASVQREKEHNDLMDKIKDKPHDEKMNIMMDKIKSNLNQESAELEEAKKNKPTVCSTCGKKQCECDGEERPQTSKEFNTTFDPFFKEELTNEEIDQIVNSVTDEDIEELYDEEDLALIYEDTGEEVPVSEDEAQIDLMEVLSRNERMKAKFRFRRTAARRGRSTRIALKRYSTAKTINKRARRLAIRLMKKRLLRGVDYRKVPFPERERVDRQIAARKNSITNIAAKLVSRVRGNERSRMSHKKFTKGNMPSIF
jgi:hypothetical protein